jgi:hypothetical protein
MPKALQVDLGMVQTLYMAGVRPSEISRQTGCKVVTICSWANRHGWKAALQGMVQSVRVGSKTLKEGSNRLRDALRDEASDQVATLRKKPVKGPAALANTPAREGRASVLKKLVESVSMIDDWDSTHRPGLVLCEMLGEDRSAGQVVDVPSQAQLVASSPSAESSAESISPTCSSEPEKP